MPGLRCIPTNALVSFYLLLLLLPSICMTPAYHIAVITQQCVCCWPGLVRRSYLRSIMPCNVMYECFSAAQHPGSKRVCKLQKVAPFRNVLTYDGLLHYIRPFASSDRQYTLLYILVIDLDFVGVSFLGTCMISIAPGLWCSWNLNLDCSVYKSKM